MVSDTNLSTQNCACYRRSHMEYLKGEVRIMAAFERKLLQHIMRTTENFTLGTIKNCMKFIGSRI